MSPLCILSFIFLVATTCYVSAAPCTPETCLDGPVIVSFGSPDCSGSGSFSNMFDDDPSTYGTCQVDSATSSHRIEVTSQSVMNYAINNPFCDEKRSDANYDIQHYIFGKCNPLIDGMSSIVLANANATYTSPQPAPVIDLNHPDYSVAVYRAECQTATNCTNDRGENPLFIIYSTEDDACSLLYPRGIYNNSFDGKTCYRQGESYLTTSCLDEHAYAIRSYLDSDCQDMFLAYYYRRFCATLHFSCLAAPIPLVPPTPSAVPTSSATSALPTFLLLLVHIIALLF